MSKKVFNISLPEELLSIIDHQAKLYFTNRSEYVKAAIITRLKAEKAFDEPGAPPPTYEELRKKNLREAISKHTIESTWDYPLHG